MAGIKSLLKDTAVYGMSSIVGRILNWLLVPIYTRVFAEGEYGEVNYLYSFVAVTLIILTYGMETGFFRFANHERYKNPTEVYSTTLISLTATSSCFILLLLVLLDPLSNWLHCPEHPSYIWLLGCAVAIDAITAIPFGYLRFRHRAIRFAVLKLINIGINIGLNLFWIVLCPAIWKSHPEMISWCYVPGYGIGYIFLANFVSSAITLLMLIPQLTGFKYRFNSNLWREMLKYSYPLLILGVAGVMNQTLDKMLLPSLVADPADGMTQLGIYGACYKIALILVMFLQAFRFAYEPFIFSGAKTDSGAKRQSYADAMKLFVISSLIIFMGVMFYLNIIKYLIGSDYWSGLKVVPVVMAGEIFFGIFFNLSVWYKITDKTIWGTIFSLMGLAITILLNFLLVPSMGYMGCAIAAACCYGAMALASYLVGKKNYPVPYPLKRIGLYTVIAAGLLFIGLQLVRFTHPWITYTIRTAIILSFASYAVYLEYFKARFKGKRVNSQS